MVPRRRSGQGRKKRWFLTLPGGLFEVVRVADQRCFPKGRGQDRQPGGQTAVCESHGNGDGWETGLWRENLAIVACRAGGVTDLAWRIAPGGVDDGVEMVLCHRCEQRIAEGDLCGIVVHVGAGRTTVILLRGPNGCVDLLFDVGQVETGRHDGFEIVVRRVGGMRQIGDQDCFEVSAPETLYKLIITGDGQWIDERSTFLVQSFESLFGEGLYFGVGLVRLEVLPEDTDACAFEAAALQVSGVVNVGRMRESFGGNRGYRVGRIRPGDYRQQYCSIGHRARHGAAYVVMPKEGN